MDVKLAYAGRLDPMASGRLLVIVGEECKRHHEYLGLDKEYVVEVVFGISSDTGDVLGIVHPCSAPSIKEAVLKKAVAQLRGKISVPFPTYSSKPVKGKPLFQWALEGKLDEIDVPLQDSRVYHARLDSMYTLSPEELQARVSESIESFPEVTEESKEKGRDFRRDEVRASWRKVLDEKKNDSYIVARITCVCSSGTYMRTLAETIAKNMGTCGLALSITRTRMGKYWGMSVWGKGY
jgi:tRNA U55 pseudouridine synthase TruB